MARVAFVVCWTALFAGRAFAGVAAFAEASSDVDGKAGGVYSAVDGKDNTAWCSQKGGTSVEALSFGFDSAVNVTHVAVILAPAVGESIDKTNRRARTLLVADAEHKVEATFQDVSTRQELQLKPALKGKRIVVEISEFFAGATPEAPVCISEIQLKSGGTVLTDAVVATRYRALNSHAQELAHEWIDDVSAPQRTLLLNVDGTFVYQFTPLMEGKPAKLRGKWSATERFLTLDVGGKTTKVAIRLSKLDEGDVHTVELVLSGQPPLPSMNATYRPAPSRFP